MTSIQKGKPIFPLMLLETASHSTADKPKCLRWAMCCGSNRALVNILATACGLVLREPAYGKQMSSWFYSQEVEHPGLPVILSSLLDLSTIRCFCVLLSTCEHGISAIQLHLSSVYKTLTPRRKRRGTMHCNGLCTRYMSL